MDSVVPNYWPGNCFGCSPANAKGLRLTFRFTEHGCSARCTIPDALCGFDGMVHGGIVCTLLDEVAAWSLIVRLARMGVTTEMSVRYLRPVWTNTDLHVEGYLVSHDERDAILRSTLCSPDGVLQAEAQSKWKLLPLSSLAKIVRVDESVLEQFVARYVLSDRGPRP